MNKKVSVSLMVMACMLTSCASPLSKFTKKDALKVTKIEKPAFSTRTLTNGITIVHKKSEDVPIFKAALYLPRGSSSGGCDIPGLAGFTVQMIREGGTETYKPDQLDEFLDSQAIQIESSQSEDYTSFSVSSLSGEMDSALKIFGEIILTPRFDRSRIELLKKLAHDGILRRKDDPDSIATMTLNMAMYSGDTRWYDPVTVASLQQISHAAIHEYYSFLMNPEGAYLVATSPLDDDTFLDRIETLFGSWKARSTERCRAPKMQQHPKLQKPAMYIVQKDFEQASIILGQKNNSISEIDIFKMTLFNRVFGSGSFDSLLFREIRDKRGLAYSVNGGFSATKNRGMFFVDLGTKATEALSAISALQEVIREVETKGFSSENINGAITSNLQTFVFRFEDPFYSISRPALIRLSGFPDSYDDDYQEAMLNLEKDNLKEFASKQVAEDQFVIAVVGKIDVDELRKSEIAKEFSICIVEFDEIPKVKICY